MKLHIREVKPGMQLEQAINNPTTGQLLLTAGTTLSIKNIDKIIERTSKHETSLLSVFIKISFI